MWTNPKEMAEMGVGMTLYFEFLRLLIYFFGAAALIVTPIIILNISGDGVDEYTVDAAKLVLTTLGNQGLDLEKMEPVQAALHPTQSRCRCSRPRARRHLGARARRHASARGRDGDRG